MTCENDLLSGPIWLLFEAPSRGSDGAGGGVRGWGWGWGWGYRSCQSGFRTRRGPSSLSWVAGWAVLADRAKSAGNVRVGCVYPHGHGPRAWGQAMETGSILCCWLGKGEKKQEMLFVQLCRNWAGLCARVPRGELDDSSENWTGHTQLAAGDAPV